MGWRLRKVTVHTLKTSEAVRAMAGKLKAFGGTESERDDKASRMARIKAKILAGEMTPFMWRTGEVVSTGMVRRVDGQHSSQVFLDLEPQEWSAVAFPITVVWQEYECDTIRDLPDLFEQFDCPWSARDGKDIMGAHLGIHDDLKNAVNKHLAVKLSAGLCWHRQSVQGQKLTVQSKYEIIHENHGTHAFLAWCGSFLQLRKTPEMLLVPVVAALYHTTSDLDETAQGFWKDVAGRKANLDEGSVQYKLAEFLDMLMDAEAQWPRSVSKTFPKGRNRPSDLDIFGTCLNAFYAWHNNKTPSDVFFPSKGLKAADIVKELQRTPKKSA